MSSQHFFCQFPSLNMFVAKKKKNHHYHHLHLTPPLQLPLYHHGFMYSEDKLTNMSVKLTPLTPILSNSLQLIISLSSCILVVFWSFLSFITFSYWTALSCQINTIYHGVSERVVLPDVGQVAQYKCFYVVKWG